MLKVTNLRKDYDGIVAVNNVSFEVQRGELFGLLGPNGAGKTTTIRAILNIIQPDQGEVYFDGKPFTAETWNIIGYLPEERGLYRKSKIISTILYLASLKGVPAKQAKSLAFYWLERLGLKNECYRKIEELSKGNQQKIQLIISLIHNPQLLVLDEPFSGLDPVNQVLLKDILMELRQKGVAIIFSTHQMEQVEKMCDNICLINKGRPVLSGELHEIKKRYGTNSIHIEYEGDGEFLKTFNFIRRADVYQNYAELELADISKSSELLANLNGKLSLRKFEIVEPSLNSIFINAVGGSVNIEEANVKPIPSASLSNQSIGKSIWSDSNVKKRLRAVVIMFFIFIVWAIKSLSTPNPNWLELSALFLFCIITSIMLIIQIKKVKKSQIDNKIGEKV